MSIVDNIPFNESNWYFFFLQQKINNKSDAKIIVIHLKYSFKINNVYDSQLK